MSRLSDFITRAEELAKKMEMEVEHLLDIIEGKHPSLTIVNKQVNPTVPDAATAPSVPTAVADTASTDDADIVAENQAAQQSLPIDN